jgi:hypothetical protein
MKVFLLAIIVCLFQIYKQENVHALIFERMMDSKSPKELFKMFHALNEKTYDLNSEEGIKRYRIFKQSLKTIKEHNSKEGVTYQLGVTPQADMTEEEYHKITPGKENDTPIKVKPTAQDSFIQGNNTNCSVNWIKAGAMYNPVPDMSKAYYMMNIATTYVTAAAEAAYYIKYGKKIYLSPQSLIDCSGMYTRFSSDPHSIIYSGLWDNNTYPFTSPNVQNCTRPNTTANPDIPSYLPRTWRLRSFQQSSSYTTNDFDSVCYHLKTGPLIVNIDFRLPQLYVKGIYTPDYTFYACAGWDSVVVGYETTSEGSYWIIRGYNGPKWGENGYLRLKRNDANLSYGLGCASFNKPVY